MLNARAPAGCLRRPRSSRRLGRTGAVAGYAWLPAQLVPISGIPRGSLFVGCRPRDPFSSSPTASIDERRQTRRAVNDTDGPAPWPMSPLEPVGGRTRPQAINAPLLCPIVRACPRRQACGPFEGSLVSRFRDGTSAAADGVGAAQLSGSSTAGGAGLRPLRVAGGVGVDQVPAGAVDLERSGRMSRSMEVASGFSTTKTSRISPTITSGTMYRKMGVSASL